MSTDDFLAIKALLNSPKNIVIVCHKNPDGDAIGSSLALYHYLMHYQHNVQVITPNIYPDFLKWAPGEAHILKYDTQTAESTAIIEAADIIFTLDFNAYHRTGQMADILERSEAIKILIDHHQDPDDYATYTYSDVSVCSTCQMIYHFIDMFKDTVLINADIATCIYLGIMTDTGSFRFRSTTSTTHRIIANLIDKGAENDKIHNNVYDANSYNRLLLLGQALSNLQILPTYKTAYITLTNAEKKRFDFKKGDTEGVVNYALSLKGIIFAAIFIEDTEQSIIKISFRSKGKFSVNQFARNHFNGGGHDNAAGGKSELSIAKTVTKFSTLLPAYKKELELSYES